MFISVLLILLAVIGAVAVVALRDRSRFAHELERLRDAARVDSSTALRNDRAFGEDLDRELLRADRTGRPASVVVFSLIPDHSDEAAVDDIERRVHQLAKTMVATVRTVDVAYRIGFAELALILPETRARTAMFAVHRIRNLTLAGGGQIVRAGVAEAGPGIDRAALFRHAYTAMLAAGRDGSPPELVYSPELERRRMQPEPGRLGS